jgi:3'-phosphoadenosine 5'-phosphosulfate sulfotransferase (PAPS reductase)/FAD synthetase
MSIYIATISGGKDSVAMCDLLLKNSYPVDYIIFNDTLAEFKEMYEYIDKLDAYFTKRYNKKITRLKPKKTPEEVFFRKIKRKSSEWYGWTKGIVSPAMGFCEWRTEAKILPLERWLKDKEIKNYKIYIGFTTDERNRANKNDPTKIYPLIDYFNMRERDCQQYLIEQEMENPLYRHFTRTGCCWCPAQSKKGKFKIWKHYPEVWEYMKKIENRLKEMKKEGHKVVYDNWHTGVYLDELEKEFEKKDRQGELFDFSDEPLKDCFCKI